SGFTTATCSSTRSPTASPSSVPGCASGTRSGGSSTPFFTRSHSRLTTKPLACAATWLPSAAGTQVVSARTPRTPASFPGSSATSPSSAALATRRPSGASGPRASVRSALLEATVLLLALVEADHDAVPQAPDQALDGGRLRVALARERERHLGHPLEVEELRPARQLGGVARVELAGVGERGERPRPLRERLAVDEVAVVRAERLVERVGERVEELLLDGEAA